MQFAQGIAETLALEFTSPEAAAAFWNDAGPQVPFEDLTYPGADDQAQPLRLYRGGNGPVLIYIHGGGWVGGSIALHDYSARGLAVRAGGTVVSISYRLAPQYPFPAGLRDCLAACAWVEKEGAALGLDPERLVIGGASAGGNLAAGVALSSDAGRFAGLLIFYGVLGCDFDTESYRRYAGGPGLTRARMQDLFDMYDAEGDAASIPLITPLLASDLGKLPPACIIAAEHDVLLDDNRAFAQRLHEAGVRTKFYTEAGVTHGYINRGRLVPAADASIAHAAAWLSEIDQEKGQR